MTLHTQAVLAVLELGEIVLAGQFEQVVERDTLYFPDPQVEHVVAKVKLPYFPATHSAHGNLPSELLKATVQTQFKLDEAVADVVTVFAGHAVHNAKLVPDFQKLSPH